MMEWQLRDEDTDSCPVELLRPESRSWAHTRAAGGLICYHGDPGPCPHSWGGDPPPQLDEFAQRAETSLKAKCPPTPPFSGTTCFALKLGTLTWEVCFPPVGHLMSFLHIPLPHYPKTWPRESFPVFFREGGDAWVREAAPDTWRLMGDAGLLLGGTPWGSQQ